MVEEKRLQPIRKIYENAPDIILVPEEMRRRRIELIIWPLDEKDGSGSPVVRRGRFKIADVDGIDIPSREERNARC